MKDFHVAIIWPSLFGLLLVSGSVREYTIFFESQGFTGTDIIFLTAAFATALLFVMVPIRLSFRSVNAAGIGKVAWILVWLWVIALYLVAPENSRLSEMTDTVGPLLISGFVGNWIRHTWIESRSAD